MQVLFNISVFIYLISFLIAAEIAAMRAKAPDWKESMEIGRDWDPTWKNMWPQESDVPEFKQTMKDFFQVSRHGSYSNILKTIFVFVDMS